MPRPPAPKSKVAQQSGPPMGLIGGVTALIVAIVAVVVYLGTRSEDLAAQGSINALPEGGGLVLNPDATDVPEVHLYEDFQCPFCGQLEQASGRAIAEAAGAGEIKLTYTFMSFLDGVSGNQSSSRAANAAVCAADTELFPAYIEAVFAQQPAEGEGYEDQVFFDAAQTAGIEGEQLDTFTSCVEDQTYGDYVQDMADRATEDGVTSSPVLMIDGEPISNEQLTMLLSDPTAFDTIIADAS
ncbi:MAG: thioredoxin domain-containing protein [Ornithinimicrobium sp.]